MPICVPVRDMKNTAAFADLVQRERDVTVTKNGYDTLHCLSNEEYALLQDEALKSKILARILTAEEDIAESKFAPFKETAAALRREHDL